MGRVGRPQKPYPGRRGPVPGLARSRDGRWRILATGERFREEDEDKAIAYFREKTQPDDRVLFIPPPQRALADEHRTDEAVMDLVLGGPETDKALSAAFGQAVPMRALWPWLRRLFRLYPDWVAEQLQLPQLTRWLKQEMPGPALSLTQVIEAYKRSSTATPKSQKEALAPFRRLMQFTHAKTLEDLTDARLIAFRKHLMDDAHLKSSGTISSYFSRIRNVLKIASRSLDAEQIKVALTRCQAKLYSPPSNVVDNPKPIAREDFAKLLETAGQTRIPRTWRAMLLLSLNAALYMGDLCTLRWENLDLEKKTLIARRIKRGKCLRVATLWPETLQAVQALRRRGNSPYVFVSKHGTRYNRNTKINDFRELCDKAGLPAIKFSHLRDGAYTAACNAPEVEERFARLLAGHKAPGLQDKYVLRNPQIVQPACDAVYQAYAPFPAAAATGESSAPGDSCKKPVLNQRDNAKSERRRRRTEPK